LNAPYLDKKVVSVFVRFRAPLQELSGCARLKKLVSLLEQEKEKLQSIIQSTNSGTWQWNIQTDETHHEIWANIGVYTLCPVTTEKWQNLIHPDDQSNLK
jgi:hypothetical protein